MSAEAIPATLLDDLESLAVELAALAGSEAVTAFGRSLAVRYKGATTGAMAYRDPVSEVDHHVEVLIRALLAEHYPDHDILGEEIDARPSVDSEVVWAIDPIDGTANFVNGFPLFAASVGVVWHGRPVVGAVWCSTSHRLRPGVYHAREGGTLRFDGEPLEPLRNPAVLRNMIGMPGGREPQGLALDARTTGSAALECALVAAGLLRAARFDQPYVWDIAGGLALVRATGGEILTRTPERWTPLQRFETPDGEPADLGVWRQPLLIGESRAVADLAHATT
jgi:myo-inositol-1(or 4)-monophosphatase